MIVVADTGPIVHLYWIGASSWALPPESILVVREVWQEIERHAPEALQDSRLVLSDAAYLRWVEQHHPDDPLAGDVEAVVRAMSPAEQRAALTRARALATYGKVVEAAVLAAQRERQ